MLFTTKWLTTHFSEYEGDAKECIPIEEVSTDSRVKAEKSLFIPLTGEHFDGHDHVKQAFENGAVAIFWEKQNRLPHFLPVDFPVFYVDDTLAALQQLAAAYKNDVNPTVIGITGSNGKTTTKDIVASVMKTTYKTHYTKGNLNNHIGLPLTILSMNRDTEVIVLEMGMSHAGEIEKLSTIAEPDYAIITNIGESHIEYLGSRQGIANAKLEILKGMSEGSQLIVDGDEKLLNPVHQKANVTTCGFSMHNDVVIKQAHIAQKKTKFKLDEETYAIALLGKHHALNATYAITLGKSLGIEKEAIQAALNQLELTSMRFEMIDGLNGISIINDAYNASPTSMKAAIEVVKELEGFKEKVLILGDVLELGEYSKELHRSVASVIDTPVTALFTCGKEAKYISDEVNQKKPAIISMHFESKQDLQNKLQDYKNKDTLLLFKASRGMQFESLVEAIQTDTE